MCSLESKETFFTSNSEDQKKTLKPSEKIVFLAKTPTQFEPHTILDGSQKQFKILEKLGAGGFGAVFRVTCEDGGEVVKGAMKGEKRTRDHKFLSILMEVEILKTMSGTPYFPIFISEGLHIDIGIVVMEELGPSLHDLIKDHIQAIPFASTIRIAADVLKALQFLHTAGFLHRDIKEHNIACGLGSERSRLFLLDSGMGRRFLSNPKTIKTRRPIANRLGTCIFLSMETQEFRDLGPKDDLINWFFFVRNLLRPLPWSEKAPELMLMMKKGASKRNASRFLRGPSPLRFHSIWRYLVQSEYQTAIDYEWIGEELKKIAVENKITLRSPYFWESDD